MNDTAPDLVPEAEPEDGHYEIIKHPKHYNSHPAGIECITVIEPMSFNVGTAIKHLWRAGLKPDMDLVDDLRKARQYIDFEIARMSYKQPPAVGVVVEPGALARSTGDGKVTIS